MKKILLTLSVLALLFTTTFAYNPTSKDDEVLQTVYVKLDLMYEKNPQSMDKLYLQVGKLKSKYVKIPRVYYLIEELENYIETLIQKEQVLVETVLPVSNGGKSYYNPDDKSYLYKGYRCGEKTKYCKYMESCDEVKYYYYQCNAGAFDGDKDGIPCESLCGDTYLNTGE
ncbi:MAG: excalibur calcium-binding domain-containing protein [Candidatus Gracilibacteria bacterium]